MVVKTEYEEIEPYRTKDGSMIRELMHPNLYGCGAMSLAESVISPGRRIELHKHHESEEIYHIIEGAGLMTLGGETFPVAVGDTILIPKGAEHQMTNTSKAALKLLCCCSPAYSHDDTELLVERQ
jgi:mannose-6-phosphate isomerase-like protein (cupin superfamily)